MKYYRLTPNGYVQETGKKLVLLLGDTVLIIGYNRKSFIDTRTGLSITPQSLLDQCRLQSDVIKAITEPSFKEALRVAIKTDYYKKYVKQLEYFKEAHNA